MPFPPPPPRGVTSIYSQVALHLFICSIDKGRGICTVCTSGSTNFKLLRILPSSNYMGCLFLSNKLSQRQQLNATSIYYLTAAEGQEFGESIAGFSRQDLTRGKAIGHPGLRAHLMHIVPFQICHSLAELVVQN